MSEPLVNSLIHSQDQREEQVIWKNESVEIFWTPQLRGGSVLEDGVVHARVKKWGGMIRDEVPVCYRSGYGKPVEVTYKMLVKRKLSEQGLTDALNRYSLESEKNPFKRYLDISIGPDSVEIWPNLGKLLRSCQKTTIANPDAAGGSMSAKQQSIKKVISEQVLGEKTLNEFGFEASLGMPSLIQEELSEKEFLEYKFLKRERPNIQFLLAGLKEKATARSYEMELDCRFTEIEKDLQVFHLHERCDACIARNKILELVNSEEDYIFGRAIDALICSLKEDPCDDKTAGNLLAMWDQLYNMIEPKHGRIAETNYRVQKLTRALGLILKALIICYWCTPSAITGTTSKRKKYIDKIIGDVQHIISDSDNLELVYSLNLLKEGVKRLKTGETKGERAEEIGKGGWRVLKALARIPSIAITWDTSIMCESFEAIGKEVLLPVIKAIRKRKREWYEHMLFLDKFASSPLFKGDQANQFGKEIYDTLIKEKEISSWNIHYGILNFFNDLINNSMISNEIRKKAESDLGTYYRDEAWKRWSQEVQVKIFRVCWELVQLKIEETQTVLDIKRVFREGFEAKIKEYLSILKDEEISELAQPLMHLATRDISYATSWRRIGQLRMQADQEIRKEEAKKKTVLAYRNNQGIRVETSDTLSGEVQRRTLQENLTTLERDNPLCLEALIFCIYLFRFFGIGVIPIKWLDSWLEERKRLQEEERSIKPLRSSLINAFNSLFRQKVNTKVFHLSLPDEIIRNYLNEEKEQKFFSEALNLVKESLSYYDFKIKDKNSIQIVKESMPYAYKVIEHVESKRIQCFKKVDLKKIVFIYRQIGKYKRALGEYTKAAESFKQALSISVKYCYNVTHPEVVKNLSKLGNVYLDLAEYEHAVKWYNYVLSIKEISPYYARRNNPSIARTLNNLARAFRGLGNRKKENKESAKDIVEQYKKAIDLHEHALHVYKISYTCGGDHPNVAKFLNDLANTYRDWGSVEWDNDKKEVAENKLKLAVELLEQAERMNRDFYGEGSLFLADNLNDKGLVCSILGDKYKERGEDVKGKKKKEKAIHFLTEALKIRTDHYSKRQPPDHPDVVESMHNVGKAESDLGEWKGEINLLKKGMNLLMDAWVKSESLGLVSSKRDVCLRLLNIRTDVSHVLESITSRYFNELVNNEENPDSEFKTMQVKNIFTQVENVGKVFMRSCRKVRKEENKHEIDSYKQRIKILFNPIAEKKKEYENRHSS